MAPPKSTAPEPELIVKVSTPALLALTAPVTLIGPLPESVSRVTAPARVKAPLRVIPPGSEPDKSAVSIVPSIDIVVPVRITSLTSVPISSTVTLPAPAFKVTSVELPPAVPRIGTLTTILAPLVPMVRAAASARSILPSSPPSLNVTMSLLVVKVIAVPFRL